MTHPLIESLQVLVSQADAVPQEEVYLAELTARLEQVADERSRCIERLALGHAAAQKLTAAQSYVDTLLAPALSVPPAVFEAVSLSEPVISPNTASISESAALPELRETEAATVPESAAGAPSAEVATPEEPAVALSDPANSESISEPELEAPAAVLTEPNVATQPDATPSVQEGLPTEGVDDPERPADDEAAPPSIPGRILSALAGGRQLTARQLADELGLTQGNVSSTLSKLLNSGRVRNDAAYPSKYRLPEVAEKMGPETVTQPAPPQEPPARVAPAPTARDREDRQAIRKGQQAATFNPPPYKPSKPVTESDEEAVLGALLARASRSGSAALLSRSAAMSAERVKEVLLHLAAAGRVIAPPEGEFQWRLA